MENIKFRAKRKLNGKWVFGSLISIGNDWCQIITAKTEYDDINQNMSRVITDTVGQFTGLTDKNGVEIYVGDILLDYEIELESQQDISGKLPVVYDSSKCQFSVDNSFKKDGSSLVNFVEYFGIENLEVVGNIHDNPELLFVF